jgi:hypothetical protein
VWRSIHQALLTLLVLLKENHGWFHTATSEEGLGLVFKEQYYGLKTE